MSLGDDLDFANETDELTDDDQINECEICGKPCEFIPFPCRDDNGNLAEIMGCCQKCHDEWCVCDCPRTIIAKERKKKD